MFSKPVAGQSFSGVQIRMTVISNKKWQWKEANILLTNTLLDEAAFEMVYISGAPKSLIFVAWEFL